MSGIFRAARHAFFYAVRWLGGLDLFVLLAVLISVAGVWAFVSIAEEVMEGDTRTLDEWVLLSLRNPDDLSDAWGPRWFEEVARDLTALGGVAVLLLLISIVAGYLLFSRTYHAMWLVLVSALGGLLLSSLLKNVFERERPAIVPHLSHVMTASFPSGHSTLSAVVYLTLGAILARLVDRVLLKVYFISVALLLTLLVGASRVYLGVHYPTDVLAGWCAGLVWAILCWLAARYLQRRGKMERET